MGVFFFIFKNCFNTPSYLVQTVIIIYPFYSIPISPCLFHPEFSIYPDSSLVAGQMNSCPLRVPAVETLSRRGDSLSAHTETLNLGSTTPPPTSSAQSQPQPSHPVFRREKSGGYRRIENLSI